MTQRKFHPGPLAASLILWWPTCLSAQDARPEQAPFQLEAAVGIATDYRQRGVSMTNYEPAWSAEAAVGLSDHVSLGVEASRVQFDPANDVEFGAAVVWSPSGWLGGANFVAGYYHYPGASGADTVELSAYLPLSDGPTLAELELTVSPEIHGPGFYASAYSGLSVVHPVSGTPVSLVAAGGIEKIADTPVKLDWSLGLVAELGQGMALRCEYVDTYRAISMTPSRAAVMLSLEKRL